MSLIKRALKVGMDVTDRRAPAFYYPGEPKDKVVKVIKVKCMDEPSPAEWALNDLHRAVKAVESSKLTLGDLEELYNAINSLKRIISVNE